MTAAKTTTATTKPAGTGWDGPAIEASLTAATVSNSLGWARPIRIDLPAHHVPSEVREAAQKAVEASALFDDLTEQVAQAKRALDVETQIRVDYAQALAAGLTPPDTSKETTTLTEARTNVDVITQRKDGVKDFQNRLVHTLRQAIREHADEWRTYLTTAESAAVATYRRTAAEAQAALGALVDLRELQSWGANSFNIDNVGRIGPPPTQVSALVSVLAEAMSNVDTALTKPQANR